MKSNRSKSKFNNGGNINSNNKVNYSVSPIRVIKVDNSNSNTKWKAKEEKTYLDILKEKEKIITGGISKGNDPKGVKILNYNYNKNRSISPNKHTLNLSNSITNNNNLNNNLVEKNNNKLYNINNNKPIIRNKNTSNANNNEMVTVYLKRIFEHYCQLGERMNVSSLKLQKYQRFAIDSDLLDGVLTRTKLELIFSSGGKNGVKSQIDFKTFLNSLIKIAEYKFVINRNDLLNKFTEKTNQALGMLLRYHLWPLYERIFDTPVVFYQGEEKKGSQVREINSYSHKVNIKETSDSGVKSHHINNNNLISPEGKITIAKDDEISAIHGEHPNSMSELNITNITHVNPNDSAGNLDYPFTSAKKENGMILDATVSNLNLSRAGRNLSVNGKRHRSISENMEKRKSTFSVVNNLINLDDVLSHSNLEDILKSSTPSLYEIYKVYFPSEVALSASMDYLKESSNKAYFLFLKEFDLCPAMISKSEAFHIFQSETTAPGVSTDNKVDNYSNLLKAIETNTLSKKGQSIGKFFNFIKFVRVICKVADLGYERIYNGVSKKSSTLNTLDNTQEYGKLNQIEKICLILDKMQLSEGFLKLEQKTNRTHSQKMDCIIPQNLLESVKAGINSKFSEEAEFMNNLNSQLNNNNNDSSFHNQSMELIQQHKRKTKLRRSSLGNLKDIFEHTNYLLEKYGESLNTIFKYFCSYADPLNTTTMRVNKFSKFLKEANLLRQLNENSSSTYGIKINDVDIIFLKVAGAGNISNNTNKSHLNVSQTNMSILSHQSFMNSSTLTNSIPLPNKRGSITSSAKMDFTGFVNSIEIISLQIFPEKDEIEALDFIVTQHILPLAEKFVNSIQNNNEIYSLVNKEKEQNPEFIGAQGVLHKALTPAFKFYQNNKAKFDFDTFIRFCTDFCIYPDCLTKSKLSYYFKMTRLNENIFTENGENEFIDQDLLIEILTLCACDIPHTKKNPTPFEKILLLAERLSHTPGANKIMKDSGQTRKGDNLNIISHFRKAYPGYYNLGEEKEMDFADILNKGSII